MRERRYAPLGVTTAQDARITALETAGGSYLSNVVEDTSPQLGGPLDMNSQYVSSALQIRYSAPKLSWYEDDQAADTKLWDAVAESGILRFRTRTDADGSGTDWLHVTRTTNTVTDIAFTVNAGDVLMTLGSTGALEVRGSSYTLNPTGPRFGQYTSTIGYVQAPSGGQIDIWSGTTSAIASFRNNGNSYFSGALYPGGSSTGYLTSLTGSYGSVQVAGAATWNGYNINARAVFMGHDTEQRFGLYDDVDNVWALQWNADNASSSEQLSLYTRDNTTTQIAARTQDYTLTGKTTSFEIRDREGTYYDAGYNVLPIELSNASVTLNGSHCGQVLYYNNTTSYTVTTEASTTTDFPVGGMVTIVTRKSSGNLNINAGSGCTIYWHDGTTTNTTGNRTMVGYSVANIWRYSAAAWFIWGSGIS